MQLLLLSRNWIGALMRIIGVIVYFLSDRGMLAFYTLRKMNIVIENNRARIMHACVINVHLTFPCSVHHMPLSTCKF